MATTGAVPTGTARHALRDRILTPSKITAWLDCAHYLTLSHEVEDGLRAAPPFSFGSLARLLVEKGRTHEADCLAAYEGFGKSVLRVPDRGERENFARWAARVGDALGGDHDVIYQMPLVHGGVRGIADFLLRVVDPAGGAVSYEPVDAKLARAEAKPGHVLQLCFYADALEAATGVAPARIHLWLGSGQTQTLITDEYRPYWRRLRSQLAALLDEPAPGPTEPEPCAHCAFCEFADVCTATWRERDALHYVAGIRSRDRAALTDGGVPTLATLAGRADPVPGVRDERLLRLAGQAALQVQARLAPDEPPPYLLVEPTAADATWGHGFAMLPAPDDGDVFLDFEGHPFWRADSGLFFLLGLILREPDGAWTYRAFWAHDLAEEAAATDELIEFLAERRAQHPDMHVFHYNHTERSSLERLATDHGVGEVRLRQFVETGLFVDLLLVARNALQAGVESYGLKHLELLTGFERGHDIDAGAGAVVEYEEYTRSRDPQALDRIAAYNEDDVRATRALRDWLLDRRPEDLAWRAARLEPAEDHPDLDAQVEALHAFGPGTDEHLLGDVLGYWLREWHAYLGPLLAKAAGDATALLDDPAVLAGLSPVGLVERLGKSGAPITPSMRFLLPPQATDEFRQPEDKVLYTTDEGGLGFSAVNRLDLDAGEVDLAWNTGAQEHGGFPSVVVRDDYVHPKPKPAALSEFAARLLDPSLGPPNPVSLALLRRTVPTFTPGHGPAGGRFGDSVEELTAWAPHLDGSYVAIQGPPGTGKTYRGAHLVRALVLAGKRVGITALSHSAISNLLDEVVRVFVETGDLDRLAAVQKTSRTGAQPGVTYASANSRCARPEFNVVAGTTWLFSGNDLRDAPVDVLVVDEAGQLALADVLAASRSARNLIVLGDPLQLPQVAQAAHPGRSGASVLEHILGDEVTMPAERGVFIAETRRMHPDVCAFISGQIYEGRLSSHPSCALQGTASGTGLRWLRAEHAGRSTESAEEAELVAAEIARLTGSQWTDQHGVRAPLTAADFLVVAPFNDQVNLIRERLDRDPATAGVAVGTVDKFQGRQAAVVFFTMTTSSSADLTRGADFLFSRHRLNVAVSRARCLAYLVCTEDLLNTRARNVDEMRLISTLCAFVEQCRP